MKISGHKHTPTTWQRSNWEKTYKAEPTPEKEKLRRKDTDLEKAYLAIQRSSWWRNHYGSKTTLSIRNTAKELGLDIETERLPLLKLIVIAEIKHQTGKAEVTQADIDTYINQQLPIDQTILECIWRNFLRSMNSMDGILSHRSTTISWKVFSQKFWAIKQIKYSYIEENSHSDISVTYRWHAVDSCTSIWSYTKTFINHIPNIYR